jgi:hypothetical protein
MGGAALLSITLVRMLMQLFVWKDCGYVDDRLCRPAALPPLPERARKARKMLAFAHIPTGTTVSKGLEFDEVKGRTSHQPSR